ncbi:MAG: hypothetical protein Q8N23_17105 [Archangium sp.]|nr:hypothetical protein [Archangium sp.]MDP3572997.1 hypothetical protein [Archangium sp.]
MHFRVLAVVVLSACSSSGLDGGTIASGTGAGGPINDGGASFSLMGETSFTPMAATASFASDAGRRFDSITIVMHDAQDAGCNSALPHGTRVVSLELTNADAGLLNPGAYRIVTGVEPRVGQVSTLFNVGYGIATSGTATINMVTPTRITGTFQTTLTSSSDGGTSPLNGAWDLPICP